MSRLGLRLGAWIGIGLAGVGEVVYSGFTDNWPVFGVGLVLATGAEIMLATGAWMRWPRRARPSTRAHG